MQLPEAKEFLKGSQTILLFYLLYVRASFSEATLMKASGK